MNDSRFLMPFLGVSDFLAVTVGIFATFCSALLTLNITKAL
jgi:hypothetical protein